MRILDSYRFFLLFVFCAGTLRAQTNPEQIGFQHFTTKDGLSQGSITAILQDHKGYMWIGTFDGLNRFDGLEFKIFRHHPQDSTSLSNNWITLLFEDSEQNLWVGTRRGINKFDRATEKFRHFESDSGWGIGSIAESTADGVAQLWVNIRTGLFLLDRSTNKFELVNIFRPASKALISYFPNACIARDHRGFLWMGSWDANSSFLLRFNPRTLNADSIRHLRSGGGIVLIAVPRNSNDDLLWVGTEKQLLKMNRDASRILESKPYVAASLLIDASGQLWVGTENGLVLLNQHNNKEAVFRHKPDVASSLGNDAVTSLGEDASGAVWAGTLDGLDRFDPFSPNFIVYQHQEKNQNSLSDNFVMPIIEDRDGNIWLGSFSGGISVMHPTEGSARFTHIRKSKHSDGLSSDNVRSLFQDDNGTIWIGTYDGGLNVYNPATKKVALYPIAAGHFFETSKGILTTIPEGIVTIDPDRALDLFLGKKRGTDLVSTGKGNHWFTMYQSHKDKFFDVTAVIEDRKGRVWVGSSGGLGECYADAKEYVHHGHRPNDSTSLSNNGVWSIYEDPDTNGHYLWVGTSHGLNKFDTQTGKSKRYMEQEGFPNAYVYGILPDDLGRLWLSTNHGLTCFDDRKPEGRKFKNYDVSDGLPGNEFNRQSFCRLRSGELMFGGPNGVVRFDPRLFRDNPYVPPVVLTAFTKMGKKITFGRDIADVSSIELDYDENVFSFEFVALNYTNPSKNQYAYMMEGFEKDWTYSRSRRYTNYTHLDPGDYVFRAKASNNDGIWNEQGLSVRVKIKPPFWGTWWAYSLYGIFSLTALLSYRRYERRRDRLKQEAELLRVETEKRVQQEFSKQLIETQEVERSRLAGELHDSLVQNLLIAKNRSLLVQKKLADPENALKDLGDISSVLDEAIEEVRKIAHNLRPYQLDRLGVTRALQALVKKVDEASTVRFHTDLDNVDKYFTAETGIILFRIVQEGITNIFKHSEATEANVALKVKENNIELTIADNGKGMSSISSETQTSGFGLSGIEQRCRMLHGSLNIVSSHDGGTTLTIQIPIEARLKTHQERI